MFTSEEPKLSILEGGPLDEREQALFTNFSFTSKWLDV
jgi:hypothetical protein